MANIDYPKLTNSQQGIVDKAIKEFMKGGKPVRYIWDVLSKEFPPEIAQLVATTEITRAYADKAQKKGAELKKEFPDVRIIKTWYTCNDHEVCPTCRECEKEVEFDEPFTKDIFKPPAHPGCRCSIDSSTALGES